MQPTNRIAVPDKPSVNQSVIPEFAAEHVPGRRPDLPALTSIRFIFSLMVVVGHFQSHYVSEWPDPPGWLYGVAPTAVGYFFVLSGFILAYNYPEIPDVSSSIRFVILRFVRIYPVHLITALLTILLFVDSAARSIYLEPIQYFFNSTLTQAWTLIPYTTDSFNGPSWSISDEWFFYLMFPIVISRNKLVSALAVLAPLTLSFWLKINYGCLLGPTIYGDYSPYSISCATIFPLFPPSRFMEFLLGVLLSQVLMQQSLLNKNLIQILSLLFVVCFMLGNTAPTLVQGILLTLVVPFLGCIIVGSLTLDASLARLLLVNRPMIFLGEISFSIYMTHMIVLEWFKLHPTILASLWIGWKFAVVMALTLALSSVLFLLVESPMRDLVKKQVRKRSAYMVAGGVLAAWAISATAVGFFGYWWFKMSLPG